jgi:recombination protein RecT
MPGNEHLRETLQNMQPPSPPEPPPGPPDPPDEPPAPPPSRSQVATRSRSEKSTGDSVKTFGAFLEAREHNLAQLLPKHMDPKRMIRIAVNEFAYNDKLRRCTLLSIYGSLLQSAATGLEIGIGGQSYLVPYRNGKTQEYLCKWIPGYRGLILLARRTGEIGDIRTEVVYRGDRFEINNGMPHRGFTHIPNLEPPRGAVWAFYGVAEYLAGGYHFEYLFKSEIDAFRQQYSRAGGDDSPWQSAYTEMSRKTVFRRMAKWLPSSIELQNALTLDTMAAQNRRADVVDGVVVPVDPEPEAGAHADPFSDDMTLDATA